MASQVEAIGAATTARAMLAEYALVSSLAAYTEE